ncbi:MAG: D-alanine--D-alanine ligase [Spirochaetaceae bacterium]|jgi:D-alanine-D-alanine ligase|nr:D-alanine--D-alanine ligase [Spirochaetaceae bacterium]
MLTVAIICGGKSAEHEISLQSAHNVYHALDPKNYKPLLIGIDKTGCWFLGTEQLLAHAEDPSRIRLDKSAAEPLVLGTDKSGSLINFRMLGGGRAVDVIFPVLHGPFGEDGTIQGILKTADIPFVGAGVLGSALGMDKDVMKRLLRDAGIPLGKFMVLRSHEAVPPFSHAAESLGLPFFVKPANMGSSVGIKKIHHEDEYQDSLRAAFAYDHKIILEEYIKGREIECAVLGNEEPVASVPGEVLCSAEFYSYEAKYLDEGSAVLVIPPELPAETIERIRTMAIKTFQTICADGLSRVDFFLKPDGALLVNEINTMPGFTKMSMYPKLFEASGVSYTHLLDRLITLAFQRFEKEKRLKTTYTLFEKVAER